MKVELSEQVVAFVKSQAPEPRRWLREALRRLTLEQGDIKSLEGPLSGFYRLRVHGYRVVFTYDWPATITLTHQRQLHLPIEVDL
jgi:mRNA-degrading endonuclease RelE of RelBE toxin-antitoxin system